jgi:two-component system OmpR family sensor kinase
LNSAEKKSIINVLILYLISTISLISIIAYSYFTYETNQQKIQGKIKLDHYVKQVFNMIQQQHQKQLVDFKYLQFKDFDSAIYDIDKNLIISTFDTNNVNLNKKLYSKNDGIYYITTSQPYYLGAAYIVIKTKSKPILQRVGIKILAFTIFAILVIIVTSFFLVKLILKPIRDNLALMDRFIKDTTHELNTPVSTILTNIEMINSIELDKKLQNKFDRIKTATLTISNIYDDLVFLILNHKISSQNEQIEVNTIIQQRIKYFDLLFQSKNLTVNMVQNDIFILYIDKNKLIRLIDNLISNAIKYTNKNTNIDIIINKNSFKIIDQGDGMTKDEISKIFQRYTRFNNNMGGFGIGYNIIYNIVQEYHLDIKIDSKLKEGTCVIVSL